MKYLYRIICLLLFSSLFWVSQGLAQNGVDTNRMNRDIRIMENILHEMFKTRPQAMGNSVALAAGEYTFTRGTGGTRGTYLPGYGVVFTIKFANIPHTISVGKNGDQYFNYHFVYGSEEDADTEINEESVVSRIKEFLRDYGSTIGQLKRDDKVMVIFGANRSPGNLSFLSLHGERSEKDSIPVISAVASKNDMEAYRSGRLSESEFDERVSVAKTTADNHQLDMRVMANIFETAFKETDEKGYRITGSVNHIKLDNFGALFFFDASYFSENTIFRLKSAPKVEIWQDDEARRSVAIAREMKEITEQQMRKREKEGREQSEEMKTAYETFKNKLKDFMVDYGRTLRSVKSNQYVMVSVSLSGLSENMPGRIDLQVKKSALEAMEKGTMSREEALDQVVVREY